METQTQAEEVIMTETEVRLPPRGGVLDQVTLHRVNSLAKLDEYRRWIGERHDGIVCLDTESAGLAWHRDRHRMTQVGDKANGFSFSPAWMGGAHETLAGYEGPLGSFNGSYDLLVLNAQSGLTLPFSQVHDAQLACHLADSAAVNKLKPRAARDIDPSAMAGEKVLADAMRKQHWTWATVPDDFEPYWQYGAMDPVLTSWLLDRHLPRISSQFAAPYDVERAYSRIAANMMAAGMPVDLPYVQDWIAKITFFNDQAMAWLAQYGVTSPESNDQVERALVAAGVEIEKRTKTGMACVDKEMLVHYQATCPQAAPLIQVIRDAKKAQSILGRFLGKFAEMADDGVLHCSIHTVGAGRTGRSSITGPAFQTFDTDVPMVRGAFRPPPGWVLISIDADQIEMRLAAHFSGDRNLIEDFRKCDEAGLGFFLIMAERIYREPVPKTDRRYKMTKNTSYATVYGSGLDGAAVTAGVPVSQLEPVYKGFKDSYRDLDRYMRRLTSACKRPGVAPYATTMLGRHLMVDKWRAYSVVDYTIQGTAAEILKMGAINVDAAGYGQYLRLPYHDELLLACPAAEAERVLADCTRILTDETSFRVPIKWSGHIMTERWGK